MRSARSQSRFRRGLGLSHHLTGQDDPFAVPVDMEDRVIKASTLGDGLGAFVPYGDDNNAVWVR